MIYNTVSHLLSGNRAVCALPKWLSEDGKNKRPSTPSKSLPVENGCLPGGISLMDNPFIHTHTHSLFFVFLYTNLNVQTEFITS